MSSVPLKQIVSLGALGSACLAFAACVAPAVSKCVPTFSNAVTLATENSLSAFQIVDQRFYETAAAQLVVDYGKKPFNPDQRWHLIDPEDLAVREQLLQTLQAYADSLEDLSSNAQVTQFDKNAQALGASLQKLSASPALQSLVSSSKQDATIVAAAIDAFGRWFIEEKRDRALADAIESMQEPVAHIAELLKADIGAAPDEHGHGGHGLRLKLWDAYQNALMQQDAFIQQNLDSLNREPVTKAREIKKLPMLVMERNQADLTLAGTASTLDALVEAHQGLLKAVKSKSNFVSGASALVAEGQRLKNFYQALQKQN